MPLLEYSHRKLFTSSGTSQWTDAYTARYHNFVLETSSNSTARYQLLSRAKNATTTFVLSSGEMGASSAVSVAFTAAYYQVAVRMKSTVTGDGITARWFGN